MKNNKRTVKILIIILFIFPSVFLFPPKMNSYPSYSSGLHTRLIWGALNCLYYDSVNESSYYYLCRAELTNPVNDYSSELYRAQEDYDLNYILQREHYWNPITKTGYVGNKGAPYHANRFFDEAVNYYLGLNGYSVDKKAAYYQLGHVVHLVQDLTVPFHAMNDPFNYHLEYESYCDQIERNDLLVKPTNGTYTAQRDWHNTINAGGWVHQAALLAHPFYESVKTGSNITAIDTAAKFLMQEAIKLTAGFLFFFWQYVHNLDVDGDGLTATSEYNHNTDPTSVDSDFDNITDDEEIIMGVDNFITDPALADTDLDGYDDYEEIYTYFTDPTDPLDSPYYFIPLECRDFKGLSNKNTKITFCWNQPRNYLTSWYYVIYRFENNISYPLYEGTARTFDYTPPKLDTFYTYLLFCHKSATIHSIAVQWSCSINSNHIATGVQE